MSFKTIEELDLSEKLIPEDSNNSEVKTLLSFFKRFEKNSEPTDVSAAEESYNDRFLFCDPDNTSFIIKDDFLKFLPAMSRKYSELGLGHKEVDELKAIELDKNHLLVYVNWKIFIKKEFEEQKAHNIKATYILKRDDDRYSIVLQLDHQILSDLIK